MSLLTKFKGWDGELDVSLMHWWYLDKKIYHTFKNVTLPMFRGGTTQIDHIIISIYGIFVTETKNMKGWIYGKEYDSKWTQVFHTKKFTFQNPLRQNWKHIKTIHEILKIPENKFHSIIMFIADDCKFKTKMPDNVLLKGYIKYIKSKSEKILTEKEVDNIIEGIKAYRLPNTFKTRRKHNKYVSEIKKRSQEI